MSACKAFSFVDPYEALDHMKLTCVTEYGDCLYGNVLHTWDDGERTLCKCSICGGYVLVQSSEYHGMEEDSYYTDYIMVDSPEEADEINRKFSGFDLEFKSKIKYLAQTGQELVWRNSDEKV